MEAQQIIRIRRGGSLLVPTLSIVACLALWQTAGSLGLLEAVPTPLATVSAAREGIERGFLIMDLWASIRRVVPGIAIGSVSGVLVGLITGRCWLASRTIAPVLHIWRALPAVALTPFFVILLGINDWPSKISIISIGVFFPVWLSTHVGASLLSWSYVELAKSLRLPWRVRYARIVVPAAFGYTVAGIRNGIAVAYVMLFISEWMGANAGIGYRLSIAYVVGRTDLMVLCLIELGALSFGTDALFALVVRKSCPWMAQTDV